ncbi:glycosyltransferase family 76 protein [Serendipita vermifera MAFF 305830]|uniref:GPI mannosyltransferase 2 n=1 Tax=Serendipita vermifera MAFF 305830 TaxID=933852 RepID=A0A0C2WZC4_SERVB|nr:glycosyltransferase family 76 protein [Serendipita vermifera MAFF 305830]
MFHFLEIAQRGYTYEHLYAFFPGVPTVMRISSFIFDYGTISSMLWGSWIAVFGCYTLATLYELTLVHTSSHELAMLATACSILSTSPPTLLHAPYTEPFFAFFSFKGMLYCARSRWKSASIMFALACTFRANGILLVGYIAWGMIWEPLSQSGTVRLKSLLMTIILSCLIISPVILHQAAAYFQFCVGEDTPDWCQRRLPLIYSHVQAKYWDVGLFRYWTPSQIPNFLLAAPSLSLLMWAGWSQMSSRGWCHLTNFGRAASFSPKDRSGKGSESSTQADEPLFVSESMTPHAIHTLVLCLILLFASHTQIVLRLSSSLPFTYWAAARLWIEKPQYARWWTAWSVLWGATSLGTWGLFLPPA